MARHALLLSLMLCAATAYADTDVQVVGLFPGAAVLTINGQRKLVKIGETGPEGVVVVNADSHGAQLRVNGKERHYDLGREYSVGFAPPTKKQFSIAQGPNGHYWPVGSINGHSVQFLVDTGATAIAMGEEQAQRIGIDYRVNGRPMVVSTANGNAQAWAIKVDQVKIGDLQLVGVDAIVMQGNSLTEVLLGMSFMARVRWHEDQGVLMLESKL